MATDDSVLTFLDAVKFVNIAQSKKGALYELHCQVTQEGIYSTNGIVSAFAPCDTGIDNCCPNTAQLLKALSSCKKEFAITQPNKETLEIKSGRFKATINCLASALPTVQADPSQAEIDERLKDAIKTVAPLSDESGDTVQVASVLLRSGSCVATDRQFVIECWHGYDMPTVALPKAGADALVKVKAVLTSFGFSQNSITFYFNNGAWLKCQLFNDKWPNVDKILNVNAKPSELPDGFIEGFDVISDNDKNSLLYFKGNKIKCNSLEYIVEGLPSDKCVKTKYIKYVKKHIKTIDFNNESGHLAFFGNSVRGIIAYAAA